MNFIKIAAISFLAGNTVGGAALPEVSEACISAFETFEACATEGLSKDTDLFMNYKMALGEAAGCFGAATDEATITSCDELVFVILAEACPSGVDPLIAACDETPPAAFGDLALDVFEDIAGNVKDVLEGSALPEVSEACISAFETFEACATEGLSKDMDLFMNYLKALGAAAGCFEAATDEATITSCDELVFVVLAEACPTRVYPLIKACDETPPGAFGDLALDVFEDIAGNVKDVLEGSY